jgi:predicted ATP-dependent serine protease
MATCPSCGNQSSGWFAQCSNCKQEGNIMNSIKENSADERDKDEKKRGGC